MQLYLILVVLVFSFFMKLIGSNLSKPWDLPVLPINPTVPKLQRNETLPPDSGKLIPRNLWIAVRFITYKIM